MTAARARSRNGYFHFGNLISRERNLTGELTVADGPDDIAVSTSDPDDTQRSMPGAPTQTNPPAVVGAVSVAPTGTDAPTTAGVVVPLFVKLAPMPETEVTT
jgi:hypothetical protein